MDKTQPFFDPYNFNVQSQNNIQQPNIDPTLDTMANPMMYYEQQYMYYKYLTQVLEYKIKLKEFENLNTNK
jgi:hypothetical protein